MPYLLTAILAVAFTISVMPAVADLPPPCPDCVGDPREMATVSVMESVPISVWTDKDTYDHSSIITLEGSVAAIKSGEAIAVTVINPLYNIVTAKQLTVNPDGTYSTTLNTGGKMWKYDGIYTIKVQYGPDTTNKVLVELQGGLPSDPPVIEEGKCGMSEILINDDCLAYSTTNGIKVTSADITEDQFNILTINVNAMDDGTLVIESMRSDCTEDGDPLVFTDMEESDDYTLDGDRLNIMLPAGTETVEIIGACVIPEFGTIAILILAVAIVSIIAVSARSKIGIMPKF